MTESGKPTKLVQVFQQREPDHLLSVQGHDMPTTDMVKVASFQTTLPTEEALEEAFRLTNDSDGPWERNPRLAVEAIQHASTSIGDVVVVGDDAYQCSRNGWKKLAGFTP